jgi:nitrogen regulatory protein PII
MKMLFLVTDSEYESRCMAMLKEKGVSGCTVIPEVFGFGRSGAKMGDRVHPGASVAVLAVVPDESAAEIVAAIRRCIAENRLDASTHAWILPVEAAIHEPALGG